MGIDIAASGIVIRGIEVGKRGADLIGHEVGIGTDSSGNTDRSVKAVSRRDVLLASVITGLDTGLIIRREVKSACLVFHHDVVKLLVSILMDPKVPSLSDEILDGRFGLGLVRGDGAGQGSVDRGQAVLGGGH